MNLININIVFFLSIFGSLLTVLLGFYSVQKFKKNISSALKKISIISFDLTGSAEQVGSVSKDLLNASLDQLDTLNSTISASHEINSMVLKTNEGTKDLNENANQLKAMTSQGQKIVLEMVNSSLDIKNGSEKFKHEMVNSINELALALKIIEEVANKTKLINE